MAVKINKLLVALIFAVGCAVLTAVFAAMNIFNIWQIQFSDSLHAHNPLNENIIVVGVDEETIAPTGLGNYENWTRANFAQVLENINKYEPKVVAFDFFFKSAKEEVSDKRFSEALAMTRNPSIFYRMNSTQKNLKGYFIQEEDDVMNPLPLDLFGLLENVTVSTAKAIPDEDKIIRSIMPFILDAKSNKYYENFPFAVARLALDGELKPLEPLLNNSEYIIKLKDGKFIPIPLENDQMLIRYNSIPRFKNYQHVSL